MDKDDPTGQPAKPIAASGKADAKSRDQRRAEELRRNLLRRKAQSRERQGQSN